MYGILIYLIKIYMKNMIIVKNKSVLSFFLIEKLNSKLLINQQLI